MASAEKKQCLENAVRLGDMYDFLTKMWEGENHAERNESLDAARCAVAGALWQYEAAFKEGAKSPSPIGWDQFHGNDRAAAAAGEQ